MALTSADIRKPETCAERAQVALDAVDPLVGKYANNTDRVSDLLTDIQHWCALNGIDFEETLKWSRRNYDEERR